MRQFSKHYFTRITSAVFIFLFAYTAINKMADVPGFIFSIGRHPLFSSYAKLIAWSVIILEFVSVIFLFHPSFRLYGFFLTSTLMLAFTVYIGTMLWLSDNLPCSCGGVLKELSWSSHFYLNIFLSGLSLAGLVVEIRARRQLHRLG